MFAESDRAEAGNDGFADELSRLKRRGACVLVIGAVRPDQRRDACRRLLGRESDEARRRILVSTSGDAGQCANLVGATDSETLSIITYDGTARRTAASGSAVDPSVASSSTAVDALADLGMAISNAIESFERDANGLEPAEIRVGIDSVVPLLEEYGRQRIFKFIHLINGRTRDVGGMAHYHLPVEQNARIVQVLSPLFDVVVELRERNGDQQERWMIGDGTHSSGWLSVNTR